MDSTVCATLAARDYDSYGLHFSYGQRTEAHELRSARDVAAAVGLKELLELKMRFIPADRRVGADRHLDCCARCGCDGEDLPERRGSDVPVTYVPFRNAHFLSSGGELGARS